MLYWNFNLVSVKKAYSIKKSVTSIQEEIMTNGPVQAAFSVYSDFLSYSSGTLVRIVKPELSRLFFVVLRPSFANSILVFIQ